MSETEHLIVRGIPRRLKSKIARRVRREKSNLNEVVVAILCRHYSLPTPADRRIAEARDRGDPVEVVERAAKPRRSSSEIGVHPNPVIDVPADLRRCIDEESAENGDSLRNVVVRILSDEFDEPFVPTGRWVGHDKRAATA